MGLRGSAWVICISILLGCAVRVKATNIVLLSIDDGLDDEAISLAYNKVVVQSGAKNPNGCLPGITWFTDGRSDCSAVSEARGLGHEIATHTKSHPKDGQGYSMSKWKKEVAAQRDWLIKSCGVPSSEVQGFRAPYFKTNTNLGKALQELKFGYDSSLKPKPDVLPAPLNSYSKNPWTCRSKDCKGWEKLSFWEVPTYTLEGSTTRTDPKPLKGKSVLKRLQEDFEKKRGTGFAVSIMTHAKYLRESRSARNDFASFLKWALDQEDTWAVTYTQYIDWIKAGGPGTAVEDVLGSC